MNKYEKSVFLLDLFAKTFCRVENTNELEFECERGCPFKSKEDGRCACKVFKHKYEPTYKDFGSMGDL